MAATDLRIRISADNQASAGLRQVQQAMQGMERQAQGLRNGLSSLGNSLKGFAGGFIGLQGIQEAANAFLRVNIETDKLKANLVTATGSVEAAGRAWQDLAAFAKDTPFAVDEVVSAFIRLKNLGLDPSREAITAYGNVASSMGKTLMDFAEAVADAVTGEFERLKEFGIKASKDGETVAFTFRGITTTVGNNAKEIEGYLRKLGEVEFAGAMERQMTTLGASIDRLAESWDNAWRRMGDSGLSAGAKRLLDDLASGLEWFSSQFTKLENAGKGLGFRTFSDPATELAALNNAIASAADNARIATDKLNEAKQRLAQATTEGARQREQNLIGGAQTSATEASKLLLELEQRRAAIVKQIADTAAADYETRLKREQDLINARDLVGKDWTDKPPVIELRIDPKLDKVDPELATNVTALVAAASEAGIKLGITSGFRDSEKQAKLWAEALKKYGSAEVARQFVAPPGKSQHEKGLAVDLIIGVDDKAAQQWLLENAPKFNLVAPVKTESFTNPKDGLIHVQLAEDKAKEEKTTRGLSEAQKEYNAALAEGARIYEATRTPVEALAIRLQELDALYQQGAIKDQETYYRAVAQAQDDFSAGISRLQTDLERTQGPARALEQVIVMLNAAYQAGAISMEAYIRAVTQAQDAFATASNKLIDETEKVRTASQRMAEAGQEIGNSIAMAFEEAILQARSLQDILKALLQDIARAVLRKGVTEPLGNFLGDFLGKVLGNLFADGGIMTSQGAMALPRFATGGIMTGAGPLPLKRYATGGIATTPQLALFGEGSMNEAYVPLPDGRSIPVSFKDQPGGDIKLDVTVNNLPGQSANVTQDSQGGLTIEIVRAQLANDMQRGGVPWVTSMERRYGMTRGRG